MPPARRANENALVVGNPAARALPSISERDSMLCEHSMYFFYFECMGVRGGRSSERLSFCADSEGKVKTLNWATKKGPLRGLGSILPTPAKWSAA